MIHCQDPSGLPPFIAHELRHYARLAPDKVRGKCHMVCHEIARWFSELTVVVGAAEWSGMPTVHCWIEYGSRVIDPTRQQFGAGPVTFWKAKRKEILAALADVVYRDDGLHPVKAFKADCSAVVGSS